MAGKVSKWPPEPPMQALWLTHPAHGVTISIPVFLAEKRAVNSATWRGNRAA